MKHIVTFVIAALCLGATPAFAQGTGTGSNTGSATAAAANKASSDQNSKDSEVPNRFWTANLSTGSYMVALGSITAVSLHQYVTDGSAIVTEVTVDTTGQSLARFYYLAPVTDTMSGSGTAKALTGIVERGRELVDRNAQRAGTNVHEMVVKNYPTTTHAHTVEYRLLDEADLRLLYDSVRKAWESGRGRKFNIK